MKSYCPSRLKTVRHQTREVRIGDITIGGSNRIAVQSMTTTKTEDVAATVGQARELAEAGCDIVRITAPSMKAARALNDIRLQLKNDGITTPLVADIHFMPKAAMEAVEHVEKVRINPGNFADYKKFKEFEYTDAAYKEEIDRLYDSFSPFIMRCKELGRAIRIGTNHGSLSDRIMNRYGDTPEGMVESALEFIRIAESHSFHDIVLSMKASNPKVMIAAYRLAVARMAEENMAYPLHLGVTEAGDGEDARVKSSIGIGALLADGLGDTLRVSLTEDPVNEVPVGKELVKWTESLWEKSSQLDTSALQLSESIDFFGSNKRKITAIHLPDNTEWDQETPAKVAICSQESQPAEPESIIREIAKVQMTQKDAQIEYWIHRLRTEEDLQALKTIAESCKGALQGIIVEISDQNLITTLVEECVNSNLNFHWILSGNPSLINELESRYPSETNGFSSCIDFGGCSPSSLNALVDSQKDRGEGYLITLSKPLDGLSALGSYRLLLSRFHGKESLAIQPGVWIRNTPQQFIEEVNESFDALLQECSILAGTILTEGSGNIISVESSFDLGKSTALAYNILQGARARISKTEFVACPSCGRTLFDLQSTTQKIRSQTNHLKGVTIAIMGCIVNGPGEMADADFGYVGGAPGKVNLYVGKSCVKSGIPETEAVQALIDLIRDHGKWIDPVM